MMYAALGLLCICTVYLVSSGPVGIRLCQVLCDRDCSCSFMKYDSKQLTCSFTWNGSLPTSWNGRECTTKTCRAVNTREGPSQCVGTETNTRLTTFTETVATRKRHDVTSAATMGSKGKKRKSRECTTKTCRAVNTREGASHSVSTESNTRITRITDTVATRKRHDVTSAATMGSKGKTRKSKGTQRKKSKKGKQRGNTTKIQLRGRKKVSLSRRVTNFRRKQSIVVSARDVTSLTFHCRLKKQKCTKDVSLQFSHTGSSLRIDSLVTTCGKESGSSKKSGIRYHANVFFFVDWKKSQIHLTIRQPKRKSKKVATFNVFSLYRLNEVLISGKVGNGFIIMYTD